MENFGLDLIMSLFSLDALSDEVRERSVQMCIRTLVHACQCRNANCVLPPCQKMKRVVTHTKICKRKAESDCPICNQLIALCCYHAKRCQETECCVPFCSSIKQKLRMSTRNTRSGNDAAAPLESSSASTTPAPSRSRAPRTRTSRSAPSSRRSTPPKSRVLRSRSCPKKR